MGTIVPRVRADGTKSFRAQIVLKRDGSIVHREGKTFERRQAAAVWLERREAELREPGAIERAKTVDPTLADAIQRYREESRRHVGKTKDQVLRSICEDEIAQMKCSEIQSTHIVTYAKTLERGGRAPQTVGNYLSHLGAVFAIARPAWGYPLDQTAMKDAAVVAKRLGLIAKSRQRSRRPTLEELDELMTHFGQRQKRRPDVAPMQRIIAFALFSTRRLEEISRIEWKDYDAAERRVLVRDMKNPGDKIGNDVWVDLPPEACRIVEAMPRNGARIFPYSADAISAAFTRAGPLLGIEDLHFHDLRHEGVTRLFEMGQNIPHVAAVSGHRSWVSLKRYTHIRKSGDRYAGWKWLDEITVA